MNYLLQHGDFQCLKAAIQNGANAVYLGLSDFNARYGAKNFSLEELEQAIDYAHLRNVKVFLTLNTLTKNNELHSALCLAQKAYMFGIDSIIVQDIGLSKLLKVNFPDLPLHASTQMTCHSLNGAQMLNKLGFKRIVLSRELSLNEIEYITSNISCEIEVFTHGALCISYSGQCLYSSLIGGRSGNRGKCAQGCRLPYSLIESNNILDNGYILSPKDLCSLELLPKLISLGITSLKIEGRMKTPEYVATVTRIYRKYIDKIYNNEAYIIEDKDKEDLLQVFNRGGFSTGHLTNSPNKSLIFKDKPNNIGICIGNVSKYNSSKGHITLTLSNSISLGDSIAFENEHTKYTVSELMIKNTNIPSCSANNTVTIGRMKGNINPGDRIYRISNKILSNEVKQKLSHENIKLPLNCVLDIHLDEPIKFKIYDNNNIEITTESNDFPEVAINSPITYEKLEKQLNKLSDTPFYFKNIKINMDNNLFIPHISTINELRRNAINKYSKNIIDSYKRNSNPINDITFNTINSSTLNKICLLLNILNFDYDYLKLKHIDKLYIPLKYFCSSEYTNLIKKLSNHFNLYIYLPAIIKPNFKNFFKNAIDRAVNQYNIKGFVLSNIGHFELLSEYKENFEFICNYTFNIYNSISCNIFNNISAVTISPELNLEEINNISEYSNFPTEFIVYGNIPLMISNYCLIGKTNKCYPECTQKCNTHNKYYLKDRMNFLFRILSDNIQTITTIYNSKINSIDTTNLHINNFRIDILDETIEEINYIIDNVKKHKRLEGEKYTNGNINRCI